MNETLIVVLLWVAISALKFVVDKLLNPSSGNKPVAAPVPSGSERDGMEEYYPEQPMSGESYQQEEEEPASVNTWKGLLRVLSEQAKKTEQAEKRVKEERVEGQRVTTATPSPVRRTVAVSPSATSSRSIAKELRTPAGARRAFIYGEIFGRKY